MFITNNIDFDNTLNIKKFAETQEAKNILNDFTPKRYKKDLRS